MKYTIHSYPFLLPSPPSCRNTYRITNNHLINQKRVTLPYPTITFPFYYLPHYSLPHHSLPCHPNSHNFLFNSQAVHLKLLSRPVDALRKISVAIATDPSNAELHIVRGSLNRNLSDFNSAIDDYLMAMDKTSHCEADLVRRVSLYEGYSNLIERKLYLFISL